MARSADGYGRREARVENDYRLDPDGVSALDAGVLLLLGTESSSDVHSAVEAFDGVLPDSRVVVLEGQGHFAHLMGPEPLAKQILGFVTG